MTGLHIVVGSIALALNAGACLWGGVCWARRSPSRAFWWLLRAGQVFVVLEAIQGGIWIAAGHKATELHLIYGLVPIGVSFMAEQLRVGAAQMTLDKRGFESTQEVGQLPESEQKAIVISILRREIAVMALSALVITVLLARAATVH
ncbi:MAG: hypothetical protein J2O48_13115 [Solirubrobacterales bacterium]|nr:hypothetical protein [Solirubrobacterales bacterium]